MKALASILIIALVAVSTAELPQVDEVVPEGMLVTPEEIPETELLEQSESKKKVKRDACKCTSKEMTLDAAAAAVVYPLGFTESTTIELLQEGNKVNGKQCKQWKVGKFLKWCTVPKGCSRRVAPGVVKSAAVGKKCFPFCNIGNANWKGKAYCAKQEAKKKSKEETAKKRSAEKRHKKKAAEKDRKSKRERSRKKVAERQKKEKAAKAAKKKEEAAKAEKKVKHAKAQERVGKKAKEKRAKRPCAPKGGVLYKGIVYRTLSGAPAMGNVKNPKYKKQFVGYANSPFSRMAKKFRDDLTWRSVPEGCKIVTLPYYKNPYINNGDSTKCDGRVPKGTWPPEKDVMHVIKSYPWSAGYIVGHQKSFRDEEKSFGISPPHWDRGLKYYQPGGPRGKHVTSAFGRFWQGPKLGMAVRTAWWAKCITPRAWTVPAYHAKKNGEGTGAAPYTKKQNGRRNQARDAGFMFQMRPNFSPTHISSDTGRRTSSEFGQAKYWPACNQFRANPYFFAGRGARYNGFLTYGGCCGSGYGTGAQVLLACKAKPCSETRVKSVMYKGMRYRTLTGVSPDHGKVFQFPIPGRSNKTGKKRGKYDKCPDPSADRTRDWIPLPKGCKVVSDFKTLTHLAKKYKWGATRIVGKGGVMINTLTNGRKYAGQYGGQVKKYCEKRTSIDYDLETARIVKVTEYRTSPTIVTSIAMPQYQILLACKP